MRFSVFLIKTFEIFEKNEPASANADQLSLIA